MRTQNGKPSLSYCLLQHWHGMIGMVVTFNWLQVKKRDCNLFILGRKVLGGFNL